MKLCRNQPRCLGPCFLVQRKPFFFVSVDVTRINPLYFQVTVAGKPRTSTWCPTSFVVVHVLGSVGVIKSRITSVVPPELMFYRSPRCRVVIAVALWQANDE